MLGLRTARGVDLERLNDRFGVDLSSRNAKTIEQLTQSGHLVVDAGSIRPTVAGLAVADTIARSFEIDETTETDERRGSTVR